ncbi:HNH endonuclease [Halonatronum saccharophilum]|uniref:HNH endonuclease n=1 Tax=Halonatronum saccharophilum TaxID=150060 RepID=UPI0004854269|nr:HNH endonuclease [Halonatronum saccharophilum]
MIESFILKEVGKELVKESSEIPKFAKGLKPKEITSFEEANKDYEKIKTRNEGLEGLRHSETGVSFQKKEIDLGEKIIEGVFPEFTAEFEMELDESLHLESDRKQFQAANSELLKEVVENPELKEKFNSEQLEQIMEGETPDGYTWHHSEQPGVMQLVDEKTHAQTGHTGGKAIWGGGQGNR